MISYEEVIKNAREYLQSIEQWKKLDKIEWLSNAANYASKADALIGLLEVHHCGSYGGHDKGQTDSQRRTYKSRLDYVEEKLLSKQEKRTRQYVK